MQGAMDQTLIRSDATNFQTQILCDHNFSFISV